jgi:hypothetical protein
LSSKTGISQPRGWPTESESVAAACPHSPLVLYVFPDHALLTLYCRAVARSGCYIDSCAAQLTRTIEPTMPRFFLDDLYARTLAAEGHLEVPRQPRSPLRGAQSHRPSGARDQSASSSEQRSSSSKRNSLFAKRPKSAMTTRSTEVGHGEESRRSSTNMDAPVLPAESDTSRSRFLFGRGRKQSKSSGSKVRASSPIDVYDDGYGPRKSSTRHKREYSEGHGTRISSPFGFQHVANIKKDREEPRDIFADFRALRRGHRAAIIGPSREPQVGEQEAEVVKSPKRPAPLRPKRSDERLMDEQLLSPQAFGMQPLRQIRSVEQFSTRTPSSQKPPQYPFQTPGPPKRPAHRPPPLNPALFPPIASCHLPHLPHLSNSSLNDEWDRLLPLYDNSTPTKSMDTHNASIRSNLPVESVSDQLKSPMFNALLEQVPEEPEGTLSNRHSKDMTPNLSLRHAKSSPNLSRDNSKASRRKPSQFPHAFHSTERPTSQGSDTLGDPARLSSHTQKSRDEPSDYVKPDHDIKDRATSWEDDIDYCYEHAAEADCDFDWNNVSRYDESDTDDLYQDDGPYTYALMHKDISKTRSMGSTASSEGDGYRLPNRVYRVPSKDALPELEYRSSHSTSTNSVSLLTPLDKFSFPSSECRNSQRLSSKDTSSSQILFLDVRSDSNMTQICDEALAKVGGSPPAVPPRSESRNEKGVPHEIVKQIIPCPLLPTPPPSANQSPVIPGSDEHKKPRDDLHINTIVAQLRRPLESPVSPERPESPEYPPPPPPKSPYQFVRRSQEKRDDEVPQLIMRGRANTLNAAKNKLCDAQSQLQEWQSALPRSNSETSVLTAIPASKSPTPPPTSPPTSKLPTPPGITQFTGIRLPFLMTPSPKPAFENAYFVPPRSTSVSNAEAERPQLHQKGSSDGSAKFNTPPATPTARAYSSATSIRPSRSSYTLFPQPPKSPYPLKSPKSVNFPVALRSAPLNGAFPAKPFSPRFEQIEQGPPTPPKNGGFRPRDRRLAAP